MPSLFFILVPLFAAIAVGVIAGARRLFDQAEARVFSRFVFSLAMPIAVFNFTRKNPVPEPAFVGMVVAYLLALAAVSALLLVFARRHLGASMREAGAVVFTGTCGNAVFLGLPIALSIPGWGMPFLTLMIFEGLLVFALGAALMTWPEGAASTKGAVRKSITAAVKRAATNPIVIGTVLGLALALMRVELPDVASRALDLFGGIASPFGLFVLGLYLAILFRRTGPLPWRAIVGVLPLKLLAFPLFSFAIAWVLTRDPTLSAVVAFFTGMPPAVSSIVFASNFRQYEAEVTALVGVGTVVGLVTLTAFLAVVVR